MTNLRKTIAAFVLLALAAPVHAAAGWTEKVVPTRVKIVQNAGFMVYESFGASGPTTCNRSDAILIAKSHLEYTELLSTALTAIAGQVKFLVYVHRCTMVGWYG